MHSTNTLLDIRGNFSKNDLFAEIKDVPPIVLSGYMPSLDGFRAISIIMVIVSHLAFNFPNSLLLKLNLGGFGVNIFFVISGFLITSILLKEKARNGFISLKNFYIRRFLRILPVAYLFLITLFFLNKVFKLNLASGDFVRPMLFFENFASHENYRYTGHYWSLSVEEQFYLIFPVILSYSLKRFLKFSFIILLFIPLLSYLNFHVAFKNIFFTKVMFFLYALLGTGISSILIGSLSAILFSKYSNLLPRNIRFIEVWQIMLFLIGWFFNIVILPAGLRGYFSSTCIALLIILSIVYDKSLFFKLLNLKPLVYVGILSYSLYIWQQIFTYRQPWTNWYIYGNAIIPNLILLILTSMISYHFYERSFLILKTRFK